MDSHVCGHVNPTIYRNRFSADFAHRQRTVREPHIERVAKALSGITSMLKYLQYITVYPLLEVSADDVKMHHGLRTIQG